MAEIRTSAGSEAGRAAEVRKRSAAVRVRAANIGILMILGMAVHVAGIPAGKELRPARAGPVPRRNRRAGRESVAYKDNIFDETTQQKKRFIVGRVARFLPHGVSGVSGLLGSVRGSGAPGGREHPELHGTSGMSGRHAYRPLPAPPPEGYFSSRAVRRMSPTVVSSSKTE